MNQFLIKRTGKIIIAIFFIFAALNVGRVPGTNSYFTSTDRVDGVKMSAGWWVAPEISFTDFGDGIVWQPGSKHVLSWDIETSDPDATITDLKLEYKCGSDNYREIKSFSSDPKEYEWTIPEKNGHDCRIKITAKDSHDLSASQESENFKINWMVVLNEFVPNPSTNQSDEWVELYNNSEEKVDVADWIIRDSTDSNHTDIKNSNTSTGKTIINPHSMLVVYLRNDYLNNSGDTVRLFDDHGNLLDLYTYKNAPMGKSYSRVPDGTGSWVDPVPTPGKKNTEDDSEEAFRKYYDKACFDDKGKSICDPDFMKSLGIKDKKKEDDPKKEEEESESKGEMMPVIPVPVENNPNTNDDSQKKSDDKSSDTDKPKEEAKEKSPETQEKAKGEAAKPKEDKEEDNQVSGDKTE